MKIQTCHPITKPNKKEARSYSEREVTNWRLLFRDAPLASHYSTNKSDGISRNLNCIPTTKTPARRPLLTTKKKNLKSGFNLLIAILIATVTFTAALDPPGGYGDDGKIVLLDNKRFRWFLTFNKISFVLSLYVIAYEYARVYLPSPAALSGFGLLLKPGSHIVVSLIAMFCAYLSGSAAGQTGHWKSVSGDSQRCVVYWAFLLLAAGQSLKQSIVKRRNENRKKRSASGTA